MTIGKVLNNTNHSYKAIHDNNWSRAFYIGTYTNPPSTSTGIARLSLNTETGELTRLDDVVVQRNPSYLTTTEHGLYTFSEMDRNEGAELAFFAVVNPSLCRLMAIIRVIWISKNRFWRLLIMALEMLAYFNWIAMVNRLVYWRIYTLKDAGRI